jgi:Heliorhodopsin
MAAKQLLEIGSEKQSSLKRYNLIAGSFHAVQAIAILALSNGFSFPVHINYLQGPPIPGTNFEQVAVFDFPVALGVAAFSILSAIAHFYVSGPGFAKYIDGLRNKRNYFRWIEYSISSTLMILLISMLNSIWDIIALIGIAAANISMILFGWLQEKYEEPGTGSLLPFWFGCIAGIIPWIAMFWLLVSPGSSSDATAPAFVYGIVISLFLLFNCFAIVQWLQYKQIGKWADYLAGEKTYITLSFVAKSLLAWQIFGGTLAA